MPSELRSRRLAPDDEEGDAELMASYVTVADASGVPTDDSSRARDQKRGLDGDGANVLVLLFLYILQGIPLGLAAAIPLILTNRQVSYKEQAGFSFAYWPFSLKLLWAPIVDSLYISRIGRRKTWLVPVQYLIGLTMLALSFNVEKYLGGDDRPPDVLTLTCMFFFLNFLAATQDIAVDGWALTMLKRHNVGHASTCNSVGQTAGYFLGYVFYLGLESYDLVTLSGFLYFWGFAFLAATTLVAIFKTENDNENDSSGDDGGEPEADLGLFETYALLWKIVRLPLMPTMIAVLLTSKIGFSAADSVTSLKLVEQGVPKDKLSMLAVPLIPLQILFPLIISRYTGGRGSRPMDVWLKAMAPRLLIGLSFAGIVYMTPSFQSADGSFPLHYYGLIVGVYVVHQIFHNAMFVSVMAFFARISDPAVGGTYMTLLNTLTNLGGNWPATLALWAVDAVTVKQCSTVGSNACEDAAAADACAAADDGKCVTLREGYYVESVACAAFGLLWMTWGWGTVKRLQSADVSEYRVVKAGKNEKEKA